MVGEPTERDTLVRALRSAQVLVDGGKEDEAVDRVHTAFQAYLKQKCREAGVEFDSDEAITGLYAKVRDNHPSLDFPEDREEDIDHLLKVQSTTVQKLNEARNDASMAHPNPLLDRGEARLYIDSAFALFRYLETKTGDDLFDVTGEVPDRVVAPMRDLYVVLSRCFEALNVPMKQQEHEYDGKILAAQAYIRDVLQKLHEGETILSPERMQIAELIEEAAKGKSWPRIKEAQPLFEEAVRVLRS